MFSFKRIKKYITTFSFFFTQQKYNVNSFKELYNYVENGKYIIKKTPKGYCAINKNKIKDPQIKIILSKTHGLTPDKNNSNFEIFLHQLSTKYARVSTADKCFSGDIAFTTWYSKRIFIIDIKNDLILTKYQTSKEMLNYLNNKNLFSTFYMTLENKHINFEHFYTIEPYIRNIDFNPVECIGYVSNCVYKSLSFHKASLDHPYPKHVLSKLLSEAKEKGNNFYNRCQNYITSPFFKTSIVHGDMWSGNILYDSKNFYLIDFDSVHYGLFYSDFIFFLRRSDLENEFLKGTYNKIMLSFFTLANVPYNPKDNDLYYFCSLKLYLYMLRR